MSAYTDNVSISPRSDGNWMLMRSMRWDVGYKGSDMHWIVPAGFQSDLASIPWVARLVFDRGDSRYAKAAILHDHMIVSGVDRLTAAAEFHSALRADGVAAWHRLVMFLAVAMPRPRRADR